MTPGSRPRQRALRIHPGSVVAVAVGGFAGGLLRYGVGLALPASAGDLPWAVLVVNTGGAFVLGLLLVLLLEVLPPTTHLRPLLATGFCGGLTTFSSVTTDVDELIARGHAGIAVAFLAGGLAAGLAAAGAGLILGRVVGRRTRWRSSDAQP